jgi:hypothetical protein
MKLLDIFVSVGLLGVLGAFIYIGRKLQVLDDLHATTDKIKTNVKVIGDYLTATNNDFDHTELQSYSPLKLTASGKKLIETLGFDAIFQQHKKDFCEYIDSDNPKLKYDVELSAIKSIFALYENKEYMDFLKVFFYNNPKRNLKNVAPTLGIYVRDKYLAAHPEIAE